MPRANRGISNLNRIIPAAGTMAKERKNECFYSDSEGEFLNFSKYSEGRTPWSSLKHLAK